MYKIVDFGDGSFSIQKENMSIPRSPDNADYQRFIEDLALERDTVEGPDIRHPGYQELRAREYPPLAQQMDMQYWDSVNGTTLWADLIAAIKAKYPKDLLPWVEVGPVPEWVNEEVHAHKEKRYLVAVERLKQYVLLEGRPEVKEMQESGDVVYNPDTMMHEPVMVEVVTQAAIEPLPEFVAQTVYSDDGMAVVQTIRNPLVVRDEQERAAAQAIVDAWEGN